MLHNFQILQKVTTQFYENILYWNITSVGLQTYNAKFELFHFFVLIVQASADLLAIQIDAAVNPGIQIPHMLYNTVYMIITSFLDSQQQTSIILQDFTKQ